MDLLSGLEQSFILSGTIPFEFLRKCVPSKIAMDPFEGYCCISLVAFEMENTRLKFCFPLVLHDGNRQT